MDTETYYDVKRRDPSYPQRSPYAWKPIMRTLTMNEALALAQTQPKGTKTVIVDISNGAVVKRVTSKGMCQ